jgi:hypothetical protein
MSENNIPVSGNPGPVEHICSICRKPYTGYGNNAQPINDGRCCDDCNSIVVIPTRMRRLAQRMKV